MKDAFRGNFCSRIVTMTGIIEPLNNHFDGDISKHNEFTVIIHGEEHNGVSGKTNLMLLFWRCLEIPPCLTIKIPRKHLCSDVFGFVLLVLEYGPYRKPTTRYSEINMYFEKRLLAIFVDAWRGNASDCEVVAWCSSLSSRSCPLPSHFPKTWRSSTWDCIGWFDLEWENRGMVSFYFEKLILKRWKWVYSPRRRARLFSPSWICSSVQPDSKNTITR